MSAFDDAFRVAHAPQMTWFGDRVRLTPTVSTTGKARYVVGGADPARPVRFLDGAFSGDPYTAKVTGSGANSRDNTEIATARYRIAFALDAFEGLPHPRDGDLIALVGDDDEPLPGAPEYRITLVEPDAVSEIVCLLIERGAKDPP